MYETTTIRELKVGQVFYTSWGYDQTNYDYVVVVGISPTGKTALCQLAHYENMGSSGQANIQKPKNEGFGPVFRLKVYRYGESGEVHLKGSYPFCVAEVLRLQENERPYMRYGWFSPVKENAVFYETDPIFGH